MGKTGDGMEGVEAVEISDKRVWRCHVCRMETTPRCPSCRVVVGRHEAEAGQCGTCRSPLPASLADCPHCHAPRSLYFSPSIAYPLGLRGVTYMASKTVRLLLVVIQAIGLVLFGLSFAGLLPALGGGQESGLLPFRWIGLGMVLAPLPFQLLLSYLAFRLRRVPVRIGRFREEALQRSAR